MSLAGQKLRFTFCKTKTCRKLCRGGYCDECNRKRREERAERRKKRRSNAEYPKGFPGKQIEEPSCVICGRDDFEECPEELQRHHILCARIAQQFGDPHAEWNLANLCAHDHAKLRAADEALMRMDWITWAQESKAAGLPKEILIRALEGYGISPKRLPL